MAVDHAENGRIALEMFEGSPDKYYDAVLMDIRMLDRFRRMGEPEK